MKNGLRRGVCSSGGGAAAEQAARRATASRQRSAAAAPSGPQKRAPDAHHVVRPAERELRGERLALEVQAAAGGEQQRQAKREPHRRVHHERVVRVLHEAHIKPAQAPEAASGFRIFHILQAR